MQPIQGKNLTNVNPMTRFALQAPTARQVCLAGDFNNWSTKAGAMHQGPDGVWHLSVALKPGRYETGFSWMKYGAMIPPLRRRQGIRWARKTACESSEKKCVGTICRQASPGPLAEGGGQ